MDEPKELRWRQRFPNLSRALALFGPELDESTVRKFSTLLNEELPIPHRVDVVWWDAKTRSSRPIYEVMDDASSRTRLVEGPGARGQRGCYALMLSSLSNPAFLPSRQNLHRCESARGHFRCRKSR